MSMDEQPPPKQRRGFAAMTPERRREIAAIGGASVPADKRSFSKNLLLATEAGRKGGKVTKASAGKSKL
jgi:general stress protein YciG